MAEKYSELRVYQVDLMCDKCDNEPMVSDGLMLPTSPPKYLHRCCKCGSEAVLFELYPVLRYKKADQ